MTTDEIMALAGKVEVHAILWERDDSDEQLQWLIDTRAALRAAVEQMERVHLRAVELWADVARGERERADELRALLVECRLQLEYLDVDHPTRTTATVLARIDAALKEGK